MKSTILCSIVVLLPFAWFSLATLSEPPSPSTKEPVRIACVGDSITQGVGAPSGFSYPAQLQKLLGEDWQVGNFGVSGRTILRKGDFPYWNEPAFHQAQTFRPNIVIIMLGTNDTKDQNWVHQDEFLTDYTDLVKIFLALPTQPQVYVCRPPPLSGPREFEIYNTRIQEEIKLLDQLITKLPVKLIDQHATFAGRPDLLPDHIHPNAEGAAAMAQTVYRSLVGK